MENITCPNCLNQNVYYAGENNGTNNYECECGNKFTININEPEKIIDKPVEAEGKNNQYEGCEYENIEIDIPEEQKLELGQKLAELQIEIDNKKDEKKRFDKAINEVIESLSAESLGIAKQLESGKISKQVQCIWELNHPSEGLKSLIVVDTGKEIRQEGMNLFDQEKKVAPESSNEEIANDNKASLQEENKDVFTCLRCKKEKLVSESIFTLTTGERVCVTCISSYHEEQKLTEKQVKKLKKEFTNA